MQKNIVMILGVVLLLVVVGFAGYYVGRNNNNPNTPAGIVPPSQNNVVCTMDAKICPDGSSVGRTGPQCEFAPCPTN